MLLKIPLLLGLVFLFFRTKNSILCASIWGVVLLIFGVLLNEAVNVGILVSAVLLFLLAFGYFALLEVTENTLWWWLVLLGGGAALVFV